MGKTPTFDRPSFDSILQQRINRRSLLKGLGALALAGSLPYPLRGHAQTLEEHTALSTLQFTEISKGMDAQHHVAEGYRVQTLLRWGDAVLPDAPAFDPERQSVAAQRKQAGFNSDFIAYFPLGEGEDASRHGLLCVNHEFTIGELMFSGYPADGKQVASLLSDEHNRIEMAAHGVSVVEVKQDDNGQWQTIMGRYNRRVTDNTPITISGPAAGHPRLRTSADPSGRNVMGTFGNCAGGVTPWNTYLTCEENVDVYFILGDYAGDELENCTTLNMGRNIYHHWETIDPRFSVEAEPHEPNRHFWVVELDPFDPAARPVKRTALGRFKHEAASTTLAPDGRVVVYMGDDEAFQCIYRFISDKAFDPNHPAQNRQLLDAGELSVARFEADGSMRWLPLRHGEAPLTAANGFHSQADVLIETRKAAQLVGGTPMDRPEDVEVNPVNGRIYAAMTKNPLRLNADEVNRRAPNPMGYVLEMLPPQHRGAPDHSASRYRWELLLEGGDPQAASYRQGSYAAPVSEAGFLACPDNFAVDPQGRLWITTDGQPAALQVADAIYACEVEGPHRGVTKQFYRGPLGCEVTGPCFTPDGRSLFVSIQHPAEGSTFDHPTTRWPDFDPALPPRSAVIVITKDDGGVVGS